MAKRVDFYFDLSSPYSYLAATQIEEVAKRAGATVGYRPVVLHAVFKATGNVAPAQVAAKARWMMKDLAHWATHYGVPFVFNSRFPVNAMSGHRLILVADREGKAAAATHALFRAVWAEDRDITDEAELRAIAAEAGLDAGAVAAIAEPPIKDALRKNTDEAIARGMFGAPAMLVGEQLFWGNDRLHFVEAALKSG